MASHFSAKSSPAGSFAGVQQLSRCGLVASAGAPPPRHGKNMAAFPAAAFLACNTKGAPLVVVAAAPGGSYHVPPSATKAAFGVFQLNRYGPPSAKSKAAGCFHNGLGKTQALGVPASFLAPKGGRLAVVVAAGAASPGGGGDPSPSADREAAVSAFRFGMQTFMISHRSIAFVASPMNPLLEEAFNTAKNGIPMVEFLLAKQDVHPDAVKDLVRAGHAFLIVEGQAKEGYFKADALVNSIEGMKLVARTFFKDDETSNNPAQEVPYSADGIVKEKLFKDLIDLFVLYYKNVYLQAKAKYGGAM